MQWESNKRDKRGIKEICHKMNDLKWRSSAFWKLLISKQGKLSNLYPSYN